MPFPTFFNLNDEKRSKILEVSIDEFAENGFEKSSISNIIKKAGIPRGSFYQYFVDKLDLYKYVIEQIGLKKHEYTQTHQINGDLSLSFIDIVRSLFLGGVHFYRNHPAMAKMANDFLLNSDKDLKRLVMGEGDDKSSAFFHSLIDEGKKKGEINKSLNNETILLMINAINLSFVQHFIEKSDSNYFDEDLLTLTDEMLLVLEKGISNTDQ